MAVEGIIGGVGVRVKLTAELAGRGPWAFVVDRDGDGIGVDRVPDAGLPAAVHECGVEQDVEGVRRSSIGPQASRRQLGGLVWSEATIVKFRRGLSRGSREI